MYQFADLGGINWCWLMCYEEVTGGARLVFKQRWHRYNYTWPEWVIQARKQAELSSRRCYNIVEAADRVVTAIEFWEPDPEGGVNYLTRRLPVVNSRDTSEYISDVDLQEVAAYFESLGK